MKKLLLCAIAVTLVLGGTAHAQGKIWNDLSWWGKSGATPAPVKDPARSGYWWWPREPKSNASDKELWGNRGKVYHILPAAPPPPPPPPINTPTPPPPPPVPEYKNILFNFNKAVVSPEGKAEVDKLVASLKARPKDTVVLTGHTDNSGTEAYNQALGQRRADAVKNYLVEQGIDASRVTAASAGATKPAVENTTPENKMLNRRVTIEQQVAKP